MEAGPASRGILAVSWSMMGWLRISAGVAIGSYALLYAPLGRAPSPAGRLVGLGCAALVAASGIAQVRPRFSTSIAFARACLGLDVLVAVTLILVHAFDLDDSVFALVVPVQTEATMVLGLRGGLGAWLITTAAFAGGETLEVATTSMPLHTGDFALPATGLLVVLVTGILLESLRREHGQFLSLFDSAPDAVLIVDPSRRIRGSNSQTTRLFGYAESELLGSPVDTLVPERFRKTHAESFMRFFAEAGARPSGGGGAFVGLRRDGSEFPAEVTLSFMGSDTGALAICAVRDVSERQREQQALKASEERYRLVVENTQDLVALVTPDGLFDYVSPAFRSVLGYEPEDLLGTWVLHHVHPDELQQHIELLKAATAGPVIARNSRIQSRDGDWLYFDSTAVPIADEKGSPRLILAVAHNVTERKTAAEQASAADAERRRLLGRLADLQEQERRRIAADIHDDTIQRMVAAQLTLQTVKRDLKSRDDVNLIEQLERSVFEATRRLRHLTFELFPSSLEKEGIAAALRDHVTAGASSLEFTFTIDDRLAAEPPADIQAPLYRIAQEALANVRKHARARTATMVLEERDRGVLVELTDDGRGFVPDPAGGHGHLGIASMRERAELARGWLEINSAPEQGTQVRCWIPLPGDADSDRDLRDS